MNQDKSAPKDLGYTEGKDKLSYRIEVHKKYSNFSLEKWLDDNLPFKKTDVIADIGCGDGNFFGIYSAKIGPEGIVLGFDQSAELLTRAQQKHIDAGVVLFEWNMNNTFPLIDNSVDFVISTFAIYYVDDVDAVLKDIQRVLKEKGEVILIGPTGNNANELYFYNKKIFGIGQSEKVKRRTNRLEKEILPAMKDVFSKVSFEIIPSKIVFPSKKEFVNYFMATLTFEESVKMSGIHPSFEDLMKVEIDTNEISKEMIMLRGCK